MAKPRWSLGRGNKRKNETGDKEWKKKRKKQARSFANYSKACNLTCVTLRRKFTSENPFLRVTGSRGENQFVGVYKETWLNRIGSTRLAKLRFAEERLVRVDLDARNGGRREEQDAWRRLLRNGGAQRDARLDYFVARMSTRLFEIGDSNVRCCCHCCCCCCRILNKWEQLRDSKLTLLQCVVA